MDKLDIVVMEKILPFISINFDEVKVELSKMVEQYKGLIVTEETIPECKKVQKELAGFVRKIETARKKYKAEMSKPIKEMEEKFKSLIPIIREIEDPIKDGLSIFEEKRIDEKRNQIRIIIDEKTLEYGLTPEFAKQITIENQYLNKTTSLKSVTDSIAIQCMQLQKDQKNAQERTEIIKSHIQSTNNAFVLKTPFLIDDFKDYGQTLSELLQEITERAKKRSEAETKAIEDITKEDVKVPESAQSFDIADFIDDEPTHIKEISLNITDSKWEKLQNFLADNGIEWEELKDLGQL